MKKNSKAALVLTCLTLTAAVTAQQKKQSEIDLQAAIRTETIDGDLKGAISRYQKLAKGADRTVAAKALVRLAQCYEKQGSSDAARTYERVVREFADQSEAVAEARKHLGVKQAERAYVTKALLAFDTLPKIPGHLDRGSLSPGDLISRDKRYLAYLRYGNVVVRDLVAGTDQEVAAKKGDEVLANPLISPDGKEVGYSRFVEGRVEIHMVGADGSRPRTVLAGKEHEDLMLTGISPDRSQIAYYRATFEPPRIEVHVAGADGANPRLLFRVKEGYEPDDFTWSGDGKYVSANFWAEKGGEQTVVATLASGTMREIPNAWYAIFSPDSRYIVFYRPPNDTERAGLLIEPVEGGSATTVLWPALGIPSVAVWTADGKGLLTGLRRPDQAVSGNQDLYTIRIANGKPQGSPELFAKDVNIGWQSAVSPDGTFYFPTRKNYQGIYEQEIDPKTAQPLGPPRKFATRQPLAKREQGPALSPDGALMAYVSVSDGGKNALVIHSMSTGEERSFYPEGLPETGLYSLGTQGFSRRLKWFPDNRSLLLHHGAGALYRFDTLTGESRRLLPSLTIPAWNTNWWATSFLLSPDGRTIYYRGSDTRIVRRDLSGGAEQEVCRVNASAVGAMAISPDGSTLALVAYFGPIATADRAILIVPSKGGEPKEIVRPQGRVRDPVFTRDGRYLVWSTMPPEGSRDSEVFSMPVEGGEQRPLRLHVGAIDFWTFSPDGSRLYFQGGGPRQELWSLRIQSR
jgi:Tol biopolymer transport system component